MTISNEAVEAAAKGVFDKSYAPEEWGAATTLIQERYRYIARAALEAAAPFIRAEALGELAAETQERSDTFMKTMQHMADSREYSADDVLRYGAYAAEANTTAYRLRTRAAEMRQG